MISSIRNNRSTRFIATFLAIQTMFSTLNVKRIFALTNGPSQPEMSGPSAVTFDSYVDPFTGDFQYSIPLFEMGDIPLTLNYNAGITSEQEASWVGLGWTLNPGSITRNVRGIPDDFQGDIVTSSLNIKDNVSLGINLGMAVELFAIPLGGTDIAEEFLSGNAGLGVSLDYNNYTGYTLGTSISASITAGKYASLGLNLTGGSGSFGELGIQPQVDLSHMLGLSDSKFGPGSLSMDISSRQGIKSLTISNLPDICQSTLFASSGALTFKYGDKTYTPKIEHNFHNDSYTIHASVGGVPFFGTALNLNTTGYRSKQSLEDFDKVVESQAYGYFYGDNSLDGNVLMDFNREKENNIDEKTPNLPIPFYTYDNYSLSCPGLSGSFRAFRNDVGYIKERQAHTTSNSSSGGVGIEVGNGFSPETDITITNVYSQSNTWTNFNDADEELIMTTKEERNHLGEGVYFAMTNEMIPESSQSFVNDMLSGNTAKEFQLWGEDLSTQLNNRFVDNESNVTEMGTDPFARTTRQLRVNNIAYMTKANLDDIENRGLITNSYRRHELSPSAKDHHIVEYTVTASDGTKYVFGLAAYNTTQKEVTFSIGHPDILAPHPYIDSETGFVKYEDGQNSIENTMGMDNYYNSIVTPAYAHSYMLTAVLSPDYVDMTGDGPTDDDLGHYIKYNYGVDDDNDGIEEDSDHDGIFGPDIPNYKWRTPSTDNDHRFYASHQKGIENNYSDDKASYIYGEKEIWYLHSIETKDYYAEFVLVPRFDALGAMDENGGYDDEQTQSRLSVINLYAKADIIRYNFSIVYGGAAVNFDEADLPTPLKSVHFIYDYSLCEGIPNKVTDAELDGDGKLTLTGLYFTYQDSYKAKARPYNFYYDVNPNYETLSYDRWGNYKPNSGIGNIDYPYVEQNDVEAADLYAASWNLSRITTPTGGELNVYYEADRYAYIQNREATYMYHVEGASNTYDGTLGDKLYYEDPDFQNNLFIFFDLPRDLSGSLSQEEADEYIQNNCVKGYILDKKDRTGIGENIYFKFYTNTYHIGDGSSSLTSEMQPEYVSGYGTIDFQDEHWAGAKKVGDDYTLGYIKLEATYGKFDGGTEPVNPISKAGWQYCMLNTRYNVMDEPYIRKSFTFSEFVGELGDGFLESVFNFAKDPNNILRNTQNLAKLFDPEKSWIRLGALDRYKLGGGHRVSKITMNDKWDTMTDDVESGFVYGKAYSYVDEDGLSSGVAAYEPLAGGDEIPLRYPIDYHHQDLEYEYERYIETPLGESFYPSPVVGYSVVTVKDMVPLYDEDEDENYSEEPQIKRQGTGKMIYRFYTAKDYPVTYDYTKLYPRITDPEGFSFTGLLTGTKSIGLYTGSQGYVVETNDMHGKPFTIETYPEMESEDMSSTPISRTTYYYKENADGTLNNTVEACDPTGVIAEQQIGVNYDVTVDFREQYVSSEGNSMSFDAEIPPAPFAIPLMLLPDDYGYNSTRIAVINKVINHNGVIEKVVTEAEGSLVSAENILFDSKTAQPIITSTQNEFDDNYYIFNMPAHWAYKGMGLSSENYRYSFEGTYDDFLISGGDGKLDMTNDHLKPLIEGDQIDLTLKKPSGNFGKFATVYKIYDCGGGDEPCYYFIDENGEALDYTDVTEISGHVLWPGRKNQSAISVMDILSRLKTITDDNIDIDESKIIIDASATEYSDRWQNTYKIPVDGETYCTPHPDGVGAEDVTNPYRSGFLGLWHPMTAFKYLTDRDYTYTQDANTSGFGGVYTNVRNDGDYGTFTPYWILDGLIWKKIGEEAGLEAEAAKWQFTATTTKINPYIGEVESKNALGVYSASVSNYNNSLTSIVANNANYNQIGFEDFEDFYMVQAYQKGCDDKHFDLITEGSPFVGYKLAHSGNFSAELDGEHNLRFETFLKDYEAPRSETEYEDLPFIVLNKDMIPVFNPITFSITGRDYLLTFWVKKPASSSETEPVQVTVNYYGSPLSVTTVSSANDIDGWYRYECTFNMPLSAGGNDFDLTIENASTYTTYGVGMGEDCPTCMYVDDVRIMPADASAKTYVYDFRTKRLMAELDENHYATFYEYDEEGKLIRIKKETERGIMTIQEGRYYTVKQ